MMPSQSSQGRAPRTKAEQDIRLRRYARMSRMLLLLADRWLACMRECKNLRCPSKQTKKTALLAAFAESMGSGDGGCFSEDGVNLTNHAMLVRTMVRVCYPGLPADFEPPRTLGGSLTGRTVVMTMLVGGVATLAKSIHKLTKADSVAEFKALVERVRACLGKSGRTLRDPQAFDRILRKAREAA